MTREGKEAKLKEIMDLAYETYPHAKEITIRINDEIKITVEEKYEL